MLDERQRRRVADTGCSNPAAHRRGAAFGLDVAVTAFTAGIDSLASGFATVGVGQAYQQASATQLHLVGQCALGELRRVVGDVAKTPWAKAPRT
jgi:hypothetical protein